MSIWEYARLALAVGLVAANVFVWWGVSLENENFSQETKDRGWRMLVRALAAEALLAFLLVVVDTKISIDQKQEIAALERAAGPRNLTGGEIFKLIDTLKPLGGKPYDLTIPPMMESGSFLDNQLVSILKDSEPVSKAPAAALSSPTRRPPSSSTPAVQPTRRHMSPADGLPLTGPRTDIRARATGRQGLPRCGHSRLAAKWPSRVDKGHFRCAQRRSSI